MGGVTSKKAAAGRRFQSAESPAPVKHASHLTGVELQVNFGIQTKSKVWEAWSESSIGELT
jgi:hypothetical protein